MDLILMKNGDLTLIISLTSRAHASLDMSD